MQFFNSAASSVKSYEIGTHRACSPAETVIRLQPLLARFGITRVANLTGLDRLGIPVVMVCRPNARSSAVFHGKGVDLASAKASGIMEAIETWHAEQTDLILRFGSQSDLPDHNLIDLDKLPQVSGHPPKANSPMLWAQGQDLLSRCSIWLPFELVHANSSVDGPSASGLFAGSTNGLASGNHISEAISHALCEVIERDATSLWRRSSVKAQDFRRLDLSTVTNEMALGLVRRMQEHDLEAAVWDITTDVGVPAFQCLVTDRTESTSHFGSGAGCHPTPEVALLRALTEAIQVRMTYIVGSREDIEPDDYTPATRRARAVGAGSLMRLRGPMRSYSATARYKFENFEQEVEWILDRLRKVGVRQVATVDLTRPEFGIPVVRVVVPGLEGSDHHAGYVPGARARAVMGSRQ